MKKGILLSLVMAAVTGYLHAQHNEVVATAGDYFSAGPRSVSWTLGEPVTETYSGPGQKLTQGMQQSLNHEIETAVSFSDPQIKVYPNPTEDQIYFSTDSFEGLSYRLNDLRGAILNEQKVNQPTTSISLSGLTPAMYMLQVRRGSMVVGVFEIIKK